MKILPVEDIRKADQFTIENEPIASIDLMERASEACVEWMLPYLKQESNIRIVCGLGNNGGDGLAIARLLAAKDYKVDVIILSFSTQQSEDFRINLERLKDVKCEIHSVKNSAHFPSINAEDIVIDAIFGSGLSKPVKGFIGECIHRINDSKAVTISIDIPSGLFADQNSTDENGYIIKADYTLSFEFPKYAFFIPENNEFVGDWHVLPIGLLTEFTDKLDPKNLMLTASSSYNFLKSRRKFSHKGTYGHGLLISGSTGKFGAAVLAAKAALRTGIGLLTAHVPTKGNDILQTAVPEAMLSLDRFENYFSEIPELNTYNAIGVGPGLGMEEQSQNALKYLIQNVGQPIVFDADALNILAENKTWLGFLNPNCILTPHPKEFERLAGKADNDFDRLEMLKDFAVKHQVYMILKGAHTAIADPLGNCYFNSTGNPGMATGGSGDVLTGMLLSLMAQGYTALEASILGVFLHGLAGDLAAKKKGYEALIAGDIVDYIGKAFKKFY
ncbi:MAG: bifunctional ADP-dependent NAD(P)H-hydrate dehydratase/NAD(P)H-hydrate epimerase [Bacteroidetes bacterium]|nr:bifunctional ADP-dependent NAD(P)H-hydrate dehydratase/NAD(P)H-hydrate epimerase [Bacteroidota bacterium]